MIDEVSVWSKAISRFVIPKWIFLISVLVLIISIGLEFFFQRHDLNLIERSGSIITFCGLLLMNREVLRLRKDRGSYSSEYDVDGKSNPYGLLLLAIGTVIWGYGVLIIRAIT